MGNGLDKEGRLHGEHSFPRSKSNDCVYNQTRWYKHGVLHRDGKPAIVGFMFTGRILIEIYVQNGVVHRPVPAGANSEEYPSMTFHNARFWHSPEGVIVRALDSKGKEGVVDAERNTVTFPTGTILRFDNKGFLGGGELPAIENPNVHEYWNESWCIKSVIQRPILPVIDIPASTPEEACAICLVNKKVVAFVPCGHATWCGSCASKVDTCPTCRAKIDARLRFYYN
jgi:hypothetical protein